MDSGASLLRTTYTQLIEHGHIKLVPAWNIQYCVLVSWLCEVTPKATKVGMCTATQPQNLLPTVLPIKYARVVGTQN